MTDNHPSRARLDSIARLRATMSEDELGVADRIAHMQAQHCVMARDEQLAKHIADMKRSLISATSDNDKERRILFIVGESDSGKTECIGHVLSNVSA